MSKLRLRLTEKTEVEGTPTSFQIKLAVVALTTDVGVVIGSINGEIIVADLTAAAANTLIPGNIYNCPIQA
jgi:hypothetical protein